MSAAVTITEVPTSCCMYKVLETLLGTALGMRGLHQSGIWL